MRELMDKLDKMQEDISDIKTTMAVNTSSLETHIKRTDLAEKRMEDQEDRIKPLEKHMAFMKGAIWAIGITGTILYALQQMGILSKLF